VLDESPRRAVLWAVGIAAWLAGRGLIELKLKGKVK
jgi:hypothetical protein